MEKSILRRLANSYDAYTYFPFEDRFESFKDKKMYFLDSLSEAEIEQKYHEFIFFHFYYWHLLNQKKLTKEEILKYFYSRKKSK
jgi:hypothetical protein